MAKKILIAEDEKPMAKALELKLNNSGFEAKAVFNGQEAIDALKAEKYDLMLLDLMMPTMDGFAVLEQMKTDKIKTPVVVTSNLSQEEDKEKAKSLGAKDYLVKSNVSLKEIVEKITSMLK